MGTHYVVHVVRTTHLMSSGSAVIFVRNGSMDNVSRSLQQEPNTSSSTNAHLVPTKERVLDCMLSLVRVFLWGSIQLIVSCSGKRMESVCRVQMCISLKLVTGSYF